MVLFPNNPVNGDNKQIKVLPLLVTVLTMLVLFFLFPPNKKDYNWLLVVGGVVGISKPDVNDGIIMTFVEYPN